ncbi:MAG: hypothetical protein GY903_27940 [Fuerstiella sp.]|nr:hypothetical protein [Fuerstiella sp.]MCP4858327.1 hypothetical protein [Fuerstiella sp.]
MNSSSTTVEVLEVELLQIDVFDTLEVSDTLLDRIAARTLRIGDFDTGAIIVSSDISRSTKTDIQISSGRTIDRGGKTIDTAGGYLHVNQNGRITEGNHIDRDGLRFVTSGTFTNDLTDGPVQMGYVPAAGQSFVPLLHLPSGVKIQGDKFSTTDKVSAIDGSGFANCSPVLCMAIRTSGFSSQSLA